MECDQKKKIVSLILLLVAVLIYFFTELPVWIPILILALVIVRLFRKCKVCKPTEEKPVVENPVEVAPEVETTPEVTETPIVDSIEETPGEVKSEVEKELE